MLIRNDQRGFAHYLLLLPLVAFTIAGAVGFYIAKSADASGPYTVWHWNVAGVKVNGGSTTNGMTETAVRSIINRKAELVSFNELCPNQYNAIKNRLQAAGWSSSNNFSSFVDANKGQGGCPGEGGNKLIGNAIFIKGGISSVDIHKLPNRADEKRSMICGRVIGAKVRFCSTHIAVKGGSTDGIFERQLGTVRNILYDKYIAAGEKVIVAGDFNGQPSYEAMNTWYSKNASTTNNRGNTGYYREVDDLDPRCPGYGEWTAVSTSAGPCGQQGTKIDMIFFRESQVKEYSGEALALGEVCADALGKTKARVACSDHRVLTGSILFKN